MNSLGITGGVGAGKSESARFLENVGIPVLDTDIVARDLVQPGRPALREIIDAFGPGFLDPQGGLDRAALGLRVFEDDSARHRLESILHPRIFGTWTRWIQDRAAEDRPLCAVVIPLLFEKDYRAHFDAVVAVACSGLTQRSRLRGRGWTETSIDRRLAAQLPMAEKLSRADYGVWTEGCVDVLRDQLRKVLESEGFPRTVAPSA